MHGGDIMLPKRTLSTEKGNISRQTRLPESQFATDSCFHRSSSFSDGKSGDIGRVKRGTDLAARPEMVN